MPIEDSGKPILLKYRFPKAYRHETLDRMLTKSRINHEVKSLTRCLKAGVAVPSVKGIDASNGIILMEWIEGFGSVREILGGLPEDVVEEEEEESEGVESRLERLGLREGEFVVKQFPG